jgi:hypothetical protein
MCMVDGADGYNEFQTTTIRRAKQPHKCGECFREIKPGERYTYHAWKFDGDFSWSKSCSHCMVAEDWLVENCRGFLIGGVQEDIQEHVQEYRGRSKAVKRLARLKIGMERRWAIRRGPRKGELMPIPQLPIKLEPDLHH